MVAERIQQLGELMDSMHLSADAVLMYFYGIQLEGVSPIGTFSGEFGPEYDHETEREPWKIGLRWPSLDDAAYADDEELEELPCDLQTLRDLKRCLGADPPRYSLPDPGATLLCCSFSSSDIPGTENIWLTLDAPPPNGAEGGVSFFLYDEDDMWCFDARVEGHRVSLTRLLELVLSLVEPHAGKLSWHEAWSRTDLYQGIYDALGSNDRNSSSESRSQDDSEDGGTGSGDDDSSSDDDGYPSSMLGDESE